MGSSVPIVMAAARIRHFQIVDQILDSLLQRILQIHSGFSIDKQRRVSDVHPHPAHHILMQRLNLFQHQAAFLWINRHRYIQHGEIQRIVLENSLGLRPGNPLTKLSNHIFEIPQSRADGSSGDSQLIRDHHPVAAVFHIFENPNHIDPILSVGNGEVPRLVNLLREPFDNINERRTTGKLGHVMRPNGITGPNVTLL
ncbi:hypothetical protein WICPIJ_007055 [Wickerhamomyces pijperi]|uniref:Uncharacterized protein n=1 Tax=Wickerhamomyces pijperi TaxID=599730 RepID=A0A9P8Q350_WICPI|nr:hypothetical protein WICPIJ_007055 [Wickerhamomyces pijperi]